MTAVLLRMGEWEQHISSSASALGIHIPAVSLMVADSVILCHNTHDDPVFVYANRTAQRLWERSAEEFWGWPSRLTAPAGEQPDRAKALADPDTVVQNYQGIRVSRSGRLFEIQGATVFPVFAAGALTSARIGQAATFSQWRWLD